jgi:serine/threonine-protein kinase
VVKILDLGLVLLQNPPETGEPQLQLTREGWSLGTVDYMAPEQVVDPHGVDIRADLYSLGCILHELLTGRLPFPDGALIEKLAAHRGRVPPPVTQLRPEVPAPVADIVAKLLAKKPADRYQKPGDLSAALAGVLVRMDRSAIAWDWRPPAADGEGELDVGGPAENSYRGLRGCQVALLVVALTASLVALIALLKML